MTQCIITRLLAVLGDKLDAYVWRCRKYLYTESIQTLYAETKGLFLYLYEHFGKHKMFD